MTKVDFYVLPCESEETRLEMVCKLAEKALRTEQPIFIHATDLQLLKRLDKALWAYRAESFVAHSVATDSDDLDHSAEDPIHLSTGVPIYDRQILINLAPEVPDFFSRFKRTLEVVNQEPNVRDLGRDRYRYYKERGYPLQHHKM